MSKTKLELGEGLALKSDILLFFKKIMQEMLRPIPVALASCTRFFEAMSAMRESFATLQDLRVGHLGKDSSQRAFGDSDFATPPWRNESSFDDLAIKTARRQEIERQEADDGSSEGRCSSSR
jgi:HAUS augmin-like complex subunit 2